MSRTRYKPINHTDCFAPYELNGMEIMSSRSPHQAGDRSNQQFCFFPPGSTSLCWFAPAIQIICGPQIPASPQTWGVCFMTHGVQHPVQQCTTMYNNVQRTQLGSHTLRSSSSASIETGLQAPPTKMGWDQESQRHPCRIHGQCCNALNCGHSTCLKLCVVKVGQNSTKNLPKESQVESIQIR